MTDKVRRALAVLREGEYKKNRIDNGVFDVTDRVNAHGTEYRLFHMLSAMLEQEQPYMLGEDIFGFNRRLKNTPTYIDPCTGKRTRNGKGNLTPNYARIISHGFDAVLKEIEAREASLAIKDRRNAFFGTMKQYIALVYDIAERNRKEAVATGNGRLADALCRIPRGGADSFYEACLFMKIIIFSLRCGGYDHLTLGRFDQYMYPYYVKDLERGVSKDTLFEVLELFFITLNTDSDLYFGVQKGDNGQSMVLGGYDKNGNEMFNELSALCIEASKELGLIDPKINLRVNRTTSDSLYELGTTLTKMGLGFPQYCNDDIAVPFLLSLGYEEEDAWNYTVAACWEYIVPGCGFDVPNKWYFDFPSVVNRVLGEKLPNAESFDALMGEMDIAIALECDDIRRKLSPFARVRDLEPSYGFLSVFVDGCIEKGLDLSEGGAKYNNYGCHGVGISNAADALAAVKQVIFEEKSASKEELLLALSADFSGFERLQNQLLACPKMGNHDDGVDGIACRLMDAFSSCLNGKPNYHFGGVWRAGTGSAMEYIWCARRCGATADGRHAGQPYGCSYSPSIIAKVNGPLSVIQSFTKFDLKRICNGGPLTLEIHDTVFRNGEGEKKVAQLVKAFVTLGGHQLQLNAVNRERLMAAKAHPEQYPHLIVRVWGWSGYFCELDTEYQDHIIQRTEFSL